MGLRPPSDLSEEYAANRTCDAYRAISSIVDHSVSELRWQGVSQGRHHDARGPADDDRAPPPYLV